MSPAVAPAPDTAARPADAVLFVDDEPTVLSALRRAFRHSGLRLLFAGSGPEALEILRREEVAAVVSDMQMPDMNGAELLERVFLEWPETKRILLTGHADSRNAIDAINRGKIWRYLEKPWRDAELLATLEQAVGHRRLLHENATLARLTAEQNQTLQNLNASLEQQVADRTASLQQSNADLRRTFLSTVQAFASLAERRETRNAGHSRRVADRARQVAERLGLPEQEQSDIFLAGLLHDIGKVALSTEASSKPPAQLTPLQQQELRQHPQAGQELLRGIPQLAQVAGIVRHHHEYMDGSGYPDQLVGLAIPRGARILAAVNDYDTLVRGMLQMRMLSPAEAREHLVKQRGRHYDPAVVDALLTLLAEEDVAAPEREPEQEVDIAQLRPGMILARDLPAPEGGLIAAAGRMIDATLIAILADRAQAGQAPLRIVVRAVAPPSTLRSRQPVPPPPRFREVVLSAARLKEGMRLARHLHHREGYLLLARNYTLDQSVIQQLRSIEAGMPEAMEIYIQVSDR